MTPDVIGRDFPRVKNHSLTVAIQQINGASHFANDLGLDSLDTVEVVMAIEEVWISHMPWFILDVVY